MVFGDEGRRRLSLLATMVLLVLVASSSSWAFQQRAPAPASLFTPKQQAAAPARAAITRASPSRLSSVAARGRCHSALYSVGSRHLPRQDFSTIVKSPLLFPSSRRTQCQVSLSSSSTTESEASSSTFLSKLRLFFQKLWKIVTRPVKVVLVNPIGRIVKGVFRKLRPSKRDSLLHDVEQKLEMIDDEEFEREKAIVVTDDDVSSSSSVDTVPVGLVEDSMKSSGVVSQAVAEPTTTVSSDVLSQAVAQATKTASGVVSQAVAEVTSTATATETELAPPQTIVSAETAVLPEGKERWAFSRVDLSGDWKMIVNEEFKKEYDEYLKQLGQPLLVRSVAVSIIGMTAETTRQSDNGKTLFIRGTNARGVWERTLVASGLESPASSKKDHTPVAVPIWTADSEQVQAEAWWEDLGTVHRSWLRGGTRYGGGDFESKRYLEQNGNVLVCETVFHPHEEGREKARVTWKFLRDGAKLA